MGKESLFQSLRSSREDSGSTHLENYFTKIVTHLFQTSPEILYAWLRYIDLVKDTSQYNKPPDVFPEKPYNCHPHFPLHLTKSCRVDIVIELSCGAYRDLIFIESKIDSGEHNDQLRRYAEHLNSQQEVRNKTLLYVTRDPDKKDKATVLGNISEAAVRFEQERWYTLQRVLQDQSKNLLFDEIIIFMCNNEMGLGKLDNKLTRDEAASLSGANLSKSDLRNMNLSKFNLREVNLSGANLSCANLSEVDLRESNLQGAILDGTNLRGANLCGANLQGASLEEANLYNADLRRLKYDATTRWPQGFIPPNLV